MQHQRQCIKEEEAPLPTGVCSATRPSVCVDGEPATSFHSGGSSRAPVRSAHTTNEGEEGRALVLVPPISSDDRLPMLCSSSSAGASPWGGPPRQERAAAAASLEDQLASIRQHRKERWRKESSSSSNNNSRQPAREDTVGQAQSTSGFDIGLWRQMKDFRSKQRAKWSRSGERKKAMTLSDLSEPNSDTATAATASAAGGASRTVPHIEKIGHDCLTLTNNFRQRSGLRPLRWETVLYKIGLQHSHSMGTGQVEFGHAGFKERMQAVPYRPRHMAENVAYSQGVADVASTAVNGWIRSPGHRKNILCPAANRCAIAVYCNSRGRYYLTQLFSD